MTCGLDKTHYSAAQPATAGRSGLFPFEKESTYSEYCLFNHHRDPKEDSPESTAHKPREMKKSTNKPLNVTNKV
jgi:hypothetical protein